MARAVYSRREIYLLDDPLSAVDVRVGRRIFEKCILGLLRDRVCILVTHQTHFLPLIDNIIILNESGSVIGSGSYASLVQRNILQVPDNLEAESNTVVIEEMPEQTEAKSVIT